MVIHFGARSKYNNKRDGKGAELCRKEPYVLKTSPNTVNYVDQTRLSLSQPVATTQS